MTSQVSAMIHSSEEFASNSSPKAETKAEAKIKKSPSLRLGDVFKAPSYGRSSSESTLRTCSTKLSSSSSSFSDLESSFASLRVEEEGVRRKSCMKVKTLEESLSMCSFDLSLSDDSLEIEKRKRTKSSPLFSTVEIREYPIMLGDNPTAMNGAPLTIDWKPQETSSCSLDEYEETRGPRRSKESMCIPPLTREEWLLDAGCSWSDLARTKRETRRIQKDRNAQMNSTLLHNKLEERTELMNRKLKRWILRRPKDRALYDYFRDQQVAYCIEKQKQRRCAPPKESNSVGS